MPLRFWVDGEAVEVDGVAPTTTLLQWLRATGRVGTKEGCAEGDCGACSVVVLDREGDAHAWRSVNSCLVLLPSVAGQRVLTCEGIADPDGTLHPAQREMVDKLGSQCGYCTPGFVMSLFEATYRDDLAGPDADWKLDDQLCGNLCRCTGYRPIRDAARAVAGSRPDDRFRQMLPLHPEGAPAIDYAHGDQRYARPSDLEGVWDAIDAMPGHRFVCGATDLGLDVNKKHVRFPAMIELDAVHELATLEAGADALRIGAAVRLSRLEGWAAEELPMVARMLRFFASRPIKNRATVGGNLCNASPIGDLAPVFMALDATIILASRAGERRIGIDEFFLGYRKTALRPGEILSAVEVPRPAAETKLGAYKVSKRRELDISVVCAACSVTLDADGRVREARLAFGGMAATTKRATTVETALIGKPWTAEVVEAAAAQIAEDFEPLSDHRGSAWYRGTVARNLIRGFFAETAATAQRALPARPSGTVVTRSESSGGAA